MQANDAAPLKVLLVSPTSTRRGGGVTSVVKAHARLLAGLQGVSVAVRALAEGEMTPDERAEWGDIDLQAFPVVGTQRFGLSPGLYRAVMEADADIVHVHGIWQFHCLPVLHKFRKHGVPYLVSPHGMMEPWIRSRSRALKLAVGALYQNAFLKHAALFHALTAVETTQVRDMVPAAVVEVVPNFVEPAVPDDRPPPWWEPAMAGRDIYVFLGRIHEKKGCRELAEAWAEACKSAAFREHSVLVFCGPLDGLESFPDEVRALDAQLGNVRFAGPQYGPDKDRSIQHATFFCLPSKSEGLPVTILDAWAAGVPTIMTPECNLDIGFDRGAALRTGFAASEVIATLQEAAALTAEQRAAMQANARALVAEHYAPESVAAGLLAMYRAALAGKPASAATVS